MKYTESQIQELKRRFAYTTMAPFRAEQVATANQESDPDWTYTAYRGFCGISVVVVADESGEVIGLL